MTREEHDAWLAEIQLANLPRLREIRRWLRATARNTRRWRNLDRESSYREEYLKYLDSQFKTTSSMAAGTYLRDRLREVSFVRNILPPLTLRIPL